jgi:hypothetical protein
LELIYGKQTELHEVLGHLENEVEGMYKADSEMQPADEEREKGYRLAENVDAQLNQMGTTLKELITKINKMHDRSVDQSNPVRRFFFFFLRFGSASSYSLISLREPKLSCARASHALLWCVPVLSGWLSLSLPMAHTCTRVRSAGLSDAERSRCFRSLPAPHTHNSPRT